MTSDQKYARLALLMGMVAAWPLTGLAAAGLVQFAAGDVQLRRGETLSRLSKGAELDGGDVVLTGTEGRAQIRFSDGGWWPCTQTRNSPSPDMPTVQERAKTTLW